MAMAEKKRSGVKSLGRGLDALLGDAPSALAGDRPGAADGRAAGPKRELPIEQLKPNPDQPRRIFDKDAIEELAASIAAKGMLQPILVRPRGGAYEIVAGERRWRAAQKAQLHNVPVIIRELTDEDAAEIALIENVQRVDLNPVEEAAAYARLSDVYKRTQEEIARAVGKSRSHVANIMRLLNLPQKALDALSAGEITMFQVHALLGSKAPKQMLDVVLAHHLSVRQTEDAVRRAENRFAAEDAAAGLTPASKNRAKTTSSSGPKDADTRALERDLSAILGLEVAIEHSKKGAGSVTVKYLTLDQLDDICRRLMGAKV